MLLNYQPIIDLRSRKVVKVEAFCRFPGSPPGLNTPDGFIPYAEQNGLIGGLTSWLFSNALEYWGRLGGVAPELSLNISVQNLTEFDLVDRLLSAAAANNVKPSQIWFEIDERLFDVHDAVSHGNLSRFTKAGVRLCLDGLGPGLSPVTHLQLGDLPVREVKLAPMVTSDFDTDAGQRAKVVGIGEIARHLSLDVAAKNVERPELIGQLSQAGFIRAQGNAIAAPMSAEALTAYLGRSPAAAAV